VYAGARTRCARAGSARIPGGRDFPIAREGASARWKARIASSAPGEAEAPGAKKAILEAVLPIPGLSIPCAVLEGGVRVISQRGFVKQVGGRTGSDKTGKHGRGVAGLPAFMTANALIPFIDKDLAASLASPIEYQPQRGGRTAYGIRATVIPQICDVWLRAREAKALEGAQLAVAAKAEILMRALAHVGIDALVDEATGYQAIRPADALATLLKAYISDHWARWAKRFPDSFYEQLFRLKNWELTPAGISKRPGIVAHYTKDIVYSRLAPGVMQELERLNPPNESGRRKRKHHQWLTPDVGHPALRDHLMGVVALMKAARTWEGFHVALARAYPIANEQLGLFLE